MEESIENFESLQKALKSVNCDFELVKKVLDYEFDEIFEIGTDQYRILVETILNNPINSIDLVFNLVWDYFKEDFGNTYFESESGDWEDSGKFIDFKVDLYEYHFESIKLLSSNEKTPIYILEMIVQQVLPLAQESELEIDNLQSLCLVLKSNPSLPKELIHLIDSYF